MRQENSCTGEIIAVWLWRSEPRSCPCKCVTRLGPWHRWNIANAIFVCGGQAPVTNGKIHLLYDPPRSVKSSQVLIPNTIKCLMQRDHAIKQIYTECGALIFLRILELLRQTAPVGLFSHGLAWVSGRGVLTRVCTSYKLLLLLRVRCATSLILRNWSQTMLPTMFISLAELE